MDIADAIAVLKKGVPKPSDGLPIDLFYYITTITPMINVDLLIKDEKGRILLSWRDDPYAGRGWHLPGGIIRYKETLETRIKKVAETELGTTVDFDPQPVTIAQIINKEREIRGHFISLLYNCRLSSGYIPENKGLKKTDPGFLAWHETCPDDLLKFHEVFREFM